MRHMTDNERVAAATEQARDNMTDEDYRALLVMAMEDEGENK